MNQGEQQQRPAEAKAPLASVHAPHDGYSAGGGTSLQRAKAARVALSCGSRSSGDIGRILPLSSICSSVDSLSSKRKPRAGF